MRRSLRKSWDMLQFMWWKVRRFNFDPRIDIRIMKYMVVTTNVSNCTIMMARTMHIIYHCIFTNMDHYILYKETEAYWHICKCNKISTMHYKYEYEKNKHIVGIRDDTDTVNWACITRTCASTIHTLYTLLGIWLLIHTPGAPWWKQWNGQWFFQEVVDKMYPMCKHRDKGNCISM